MAINIKSDHFVDGANVVNLGTNGSPMSPTRIVIHYTAGSTLSGAVSTLTSKKLGYNILIDKDGSLHQTRPFTRSANHAGRSNWKAASGLTNASSLNGTSIGISLVNLGQFGYYSAGRWWWGGPGSGPSVDDAAANKHSLIYRPNRPTHWTPYEPNQLKVCRDLVEALCNRYPDIVEIVGHDDIAISQKSDPGPVCPVAKWRRDFGKEGPLGLASKVKSSDGELNLRDLPSDSGKVIKVLKNGDDLHIRSVAYTSASKGLVNGGSQRALSRWASVDIAGTNTHAGFVDMRYLTVRPLAPAYAAAL
jgi:N-acetylmuramoyl-L-alanine amidase